MYVRTVHMYVCMSIGQWNEKIMKLGQHFCSSQASTNTTSTHQLLGVLIPHNVNTSQMVIRLGLAISRARERERERERVVVAHRPYLVGGWEWVVNQKIVGRKGKSAPRELNCHFLCYHYNNKQRWSRPQIVPRFWKISQVQIRRKQSNFREIYYKNHFRGNLYNLPHIIELKTAGGGLSLQNKPFSVWFDHFCGQPW